VKALEQAFCDERAAVLATITRRLGGDLALAEDAVQDAFVAAAVEWNRRGVPDRPGAWLTTTAWRKALDRLRHDRVAAARAADLAHEPVSDDIDFDESALQDDQLRMVFTCCHPALPPAARMALTLRSVASLTVPEIARAFLSSEEAIERRLTRARRKVTDAAIPFRVPPDELLPERLAGVLRVIYLVYTEGHSATRGEVPVRGDLCEEAIRLARLLAQLMPDEAETLGLLALLLLTDARRPARVDAAGDLAALEHQDRSRWDARRIADGRATLDRALKLRRSGAYVIQAAIAALHAQAPDFDSTDWPQIAALYDALARLDPSPVVAVNRAVAVGLADGPHTGLAILEAAAADPGLARYQPLHAARAELLRHVGDAAGADAAYERAIALTSNQAQRAALQRLRARTPPRIPAAANGSVSPTSRPGTRHITPPGLSPGPLRDPERATRASVLLRARSDTQRVRCLDASRRAARRRCDFCNPTSRVCRARAAAHALVNGTRRTPIQDVAQAVAAPAPLPAVAASRPVVRFDGSPVTLTPRPGSYW
jgi:RNA polymerase sigma-70 factor, ECF subfamily